MRCRLAPRPLGLSRSSIQEAFIDEEQQAPDASLQIDTVSTTLTEREANYLSAKQAYSTPHDGFLPAQPLQSGRVLRAALPPPR